MNQRNKFLVFWLILSMSLFFGCGDQSPEYDFYDSGDDNPALAKVAGAPGQTEAWSISADTPSHGATFIKSTDRGFTCNASHSIPGYFSSDEKIHVDTWKWGAKAAISLTCDEGVEQPYYILMPEVESRGWLMTFFIYTEQPYWEETWADIQFAYQSGHEVASHTNTHRDMTIFGEIGIRNELETAFALLRYYLGDDYISQSFSYPFEITNEFIWSVTKDYHDYARSGDFGVPVPPNPVPLNDAFNPEWGALTAKANTQDITVPSWNAWIDAAVAQEKWLIEEYHGVCDGADCGGWEPRTIEEFQAHFNHIDSYGDDIWVAPMGTVGNYIRERNTVQFKVDHWCDQLVEIKLKDKYSEPYNTPLTFVVETDPAWGWTNVQAFQNGVQVTAVSLGGGKFRIEGLPDPSLPISINPL